MGKIKEFMTLQEAKKIKKKLESNIDNIKCEISYEGRSAPHWELNIRKKYEHVPLKFSDVDVKDIINQIIYVCTKYYISFTIHRHSDDNIYISIDLK